VVIIGAGFGGLACAKKLAGSNVRVLILDQHNYHLFTPLLYQVASSLLNPGDIARPVRSVFAGSPNVSFRLERVAGIDFEAHLVSTSGGEAIPYDRLVIAAGSTTQFFGVEGAEERALGLKDLPEALELRNHILACLEHASAHPDSAAAWLTFVVAGGGPTGVEYAGALSELLRVLPKEYTELRRHRPRVLLVEGKPELLPVFPGDLGRAARTELGRKGVEVRPGVTVLGYDGSSVSLSDGSRIEANTLVWAAGVKPATLAAAIDVPRTRSGRIEVDEFLRVPGHPDVYAIGDVAAAKTPDGREVPMLSAPAMAEARRVAENILRAERGEAPLPYRYHDKGSMATIGKNAAVAAIGRIHLRGFIGWVAWLTVHLYYIIGFRNRAAVLMSWAWNYLRSDRPVRIIARANDRDDDAAADQPEVPGSSAQAAGRR
jgi:NADH dehydrogenase